MYLLQKQSHIYQKSTKNLKKSNFKKSLLKMEKSQKYEKSKFCLKYSWLFELAMSSILYASHKMVLILHKYFTHDITSHVKLFLEEIKRNKFNQLVSDLLLY